VNGQPGIFIFDTEDGTISAWTAGLQHLDGGQFRYPISGHGRSL